MSAPDKQNQKVSEQKVNDVKHLVDYTLFAYQAPIIFWCYCMQFVVYCLNLTARLRLNYRTSTEALTGLTHDISHLKFTFWKNNWYYEYNGKLPSSSWKPCHVIMFTDHQGDQFTYNIWTVDKDDSWLDDRELTWDIVIPRLSDHKPPATSLLTLQDYEQLQFKTLSIRLKQKTTNMTGKRNRKQAADKASRKVPTQLKQRKAAPWKAKLNNVLTMCTADLTKNEEEYDNSLDPSENMIRQPPPSDHNPDTVLVYIVTGGE